MRDEREERRKEGRKEGAYCGRDREESDNEASFRGKKKKKHPREGLCGGEGSRDVQHTGDLLTRK